MIPGWVKGLTLMLVMLGVGIALGISYGRRTAPRNDMGAMAPASVLRALDRALALDSTQHAAIAAIMTRRQSAIDAAWKTLQPSVRAAVDSSQMEIAKVLRADQQSKFTELLRASHPTAQPMSERP